MSQQTPSANTGLESFTLVTDSGAHAEISVYGAQVTSWRTAGSDRERLFLSDKSHFEPGTAIRGGVPIIFPQFAGRGPLAKHGFARTSQWQLLSSEQLNGNIAQAVLILSSSEGTKQLWPHDFSASFTVTLRDKELDMQLEVLNTGSAPFTFTAALHSYLAVGDIHNTRLSGLRDSQYETAKGQLQPETLDALTFDQTIDRIYHQTPSPLNLESPAQKLEICADGFEDTVVWNPWAEGCAGMDDMSEDAYLKMLCVEAATAITPVSLGSNESWIGQQTLLATDDLTQ